MKITSVRFRLLIWNIGLLTLVLVGFLLIVHTTVRTYAVSAIDQRLKSIADHTALISMRHFGTPHPQPPHRDEPRRPDGSRRERMVRIIDINGHTSAPPPPPGTTRKPPWDAAAFTQASRGNAVFSMATGDDEAHLRVYSRPIYNNGQIVAVIQSAAPFTDVEVMLQNLTLTLTLLIPLALIIASLAGLIMTHQALYPVRQIVETANSLHPDDLSRRLPVVGKDEFAHLANTINGLLGRLEETFTRLKHGIERERRFTADASHELRTPLTAIKINTSLTLRGNRTADEYKDALRSIDQSADTMSRLVQDLLLLARSDSGQLPMTFEVIHPDDLCNEAATLVRHTESDAKLSVQTADSPGVIFGDAGSLQRLLVNLMNNALRHTPSDGSVILEAKEVADKVILSVTDTGTGIAPEHIPHLGERFYRVDEARTRDMGGTGLGLAICKSIVEAHQGTMSIDSKLGAGTTVSVVLNRHIDA